MKIDKNYLHEMYNATSTDDGKGDLETYENWLERQLISRIKQLRNPSSKGQFTCNNCQGCGCTFCSGSGFLIINKMINMADTIQLLRLLGVEIKYNFNGGDEMLTIDNNTDKESLKTIKIFCKKHGIIFNELQNTIKNN